MKKKISMKLFLTVLWKSVCQVFQSVAKIFGYKEGTTYGKVLWRIFATCFVASFALLTLFFVYCFLDNVVYRDWIRPHTSDRVYDFKYISKDIIHQKYYYGNSGRIYSKKLDKVVLDKVDWVCNSYDNDSLAVFAKESKRGYLNRYTGEVVIPTLYTRAWVFSEGLAAVEYEGRLVFINHAGEIVIDNNLTVYPDDPRYAFHDGYCIVQDVVSGKSGLIDRKGNWALTPEYDAIYHDYSFWRVQKDCLYGLFSENIDTLFAVDNPQIYLNDEVIEVRFSDHTAKRFDHDGNLLVDFVIDEVEYMEYETPELKTYNDAEGFCTTVAVRDVANRLRYMVNSGDYDSYYGLMDRNGKRITPPEYSSIEAIAEDLYLCQPQGIIINGKGQLVE